MSQRTDHVNVTDVGGGAVGCASIGDYESILSMGPDYECPVAKKSMNWQHYVRTTHTH